MSERVKKREDLIGDTGVIIRTFKVIDAREGIHGVDVRVCDSDGEEYWTSLEDVELDSGVTK
ncbi:hypothetical protein LW858_15945 [Bacillus cereus]|uniref:Uncharacterized protein n=1 Tax=Bacillus cereus TaxID=1396 RepID=A0A9X8IXV9_BACCE|nr:MULTISPECIES: hypothetical protein [Bacillus cereus group]OUA56816.1 hypothetical protein BK781_18630 [Bacillus thuringiensis serovar aizawai]PGO61788.1 hypothetical protein CN980_29095 [Bacillus cereus]RWQ72523.1 hypothetical protein DR116_0018285 [Bacillus cereus]UIJ64488.1 hypothetical protein LW858_15945 [Bacillus cereus]